jgi:hypothetical protein
VDEFGVGDDLALISKKAILSNSMSALPINQSAEISALGTIPEGPRLPLNNRILKSSSWREVICW